jgi:hypothetical protein
VDSDTEDPLPGRLHTAISEEIAPQGAPSASSGQDTDSGWKGTTRSPLGQRSLGLATRGNIAGKDESGPARRPGASRQQGGCSGRDSLSGLERGVISGLLSGRCGPSSAKTARVQHILDGNMQVNKWTPARTLTPERKGSLMGKTLGENWKS